MVVSIYHDNKSRPLLRHLGCRNYFSDSSEMKTFTSFPKMEATVFVDNLPYELKEDEFCECFSQFGNVESVIILKQKYHGEVLSKGKGFVSFKTQEDAQKVLDLQDKIVLKTRELKTSLAKPKKEVYDNIHVSNIADTVDEQMLMNLFKHYHPQAATIVSRYVSDENPGFAFVKVESKEDRDEAIRILDDHKLEGLNIKLSAAHRNYIEVKPKKNRHKKSKKNKFVYVPEN